MKRNPGYNDKRTGRISNDMDSCIRNPSGKRIYAVRIDEHTMMQINEIAKRTQTSRSLVIRVLLSRSLNEITDDEGNINLKGM